MFFLDSPLLLVGDFSANAVNQIPELDCDCACSTTPFQVSFGENLTRSFAAVADTYTTPLSPDFHLVFSPFAPGGPSVLNATGWQRYQDFVQHPQPLTQAFDRQLAQQNLIAPQGISLQPQPSPPEQLTVWLHVTNACNLDCPYCYVRKSSAVLDCTQGFAILDQLFVTAQQNGFRHLKLKYAGGEATLEFKLIQALHHHAQTLAAKTGIELKAVVLSNGTTLSPALVDWLEKNQVRLMVSLDGLGDVHDRQRPNRQGQPSFATIVHKLETLILPSTIDLHLSVTVTSVNAPHLADLVAWILERDWSFSLNFYRVPPQSSAPEDFALADASFIAGMKAAYQVIENHLPDRPLLNGLLDKVQTTAHTHTCGVSQSYVVVTHEGKIAQCQMHLEQTLPETIAPLSEKDLLRELAQAPIQNLSVDQKIGCASCTYRYRCTGGCPVETFRFTGRWDLKSPHCQIYKALYPEVLRLEGLRLLQINGLLLSCKSGVTQKKTGRIK